MIGRPGPRSGHGHAGGVHYTKERERRRAALEYQRKISLARSGVCPECRGSGRTLIFFKCGDCNGTGRYYSGSRY